MAPLPLNHAGGGAAQPAESSQQCARLGGELHHHWHVRQQKTFARLSQPVSCQEARSRTAYHSVSNVPKSMPISRSANPTYATVARDSFQSGVESLERRNRAIARTASQGEPFYGWNAARVLINRSNSDGLVASMPRCTRVLSLLPLLLWCAEHTVSGEPRSNPREHDRGARPWSRQRCGGKAPGNRADIVTRWGSTAKPLMRPT